MFIKNDHVRNLIFEKIFLLSFLINVLKSLFRIINHRSGNSLLKATFMMIQYCKNDSFVIKMREWLSNLWPSTIDYSDLLPYIHRHTNKIRKLNKILFKLIRILSLNPFIIDWLQVLRRLWGLKVR